MIIEKAANRDLLRDDRFCVVDAGLDLGCSSRSQVQLSLQNVSKS
jgi:hypothetical protein